MGLARVWLEKKLHSRLGMLPSIATYHHAAR